jgi:hypothetical protein
MNLATDLAALAAETAAALPLIVTGQAPPIEFFTPSQLRAYRPPPGSVLVGQNHIVRGATFVIGGAPGVGKSRAGTALAVAGATGEPWFGLSVPRQFRTLIVQNENGRLRLSDEFFALPCETLDAWVRVSAPPPFGLALRHADFRQMLAAEIASFKPDVVLIDPWNAVATDDKARDYLDTFELLRGLIPAKDDSPALGIIAHTRKPKHDERASGRGLLNLLAGSYVLASVPRSVFVLQPATDAPDDSRVVFTCCKNNDGDMGTPSAWTRRNGLFAPVPEFDWDEFRTPSVDRTTITAADVAEALAHGERPVAKQDAVQALMHTTGCEKSAAYNALKLDGRFKGQLRNEGKSGALRWTADNRKSLL